MTDELIETNSAGGAGQSRVGRIDPNIGPRHPKVRSHQRLPLGLRADLLRMGRIIANQGDDRYNAQQHCHKAVGASAQKTTAYPHLRLIDVGVACRTVQRWIATASS